jgi:predicted MFS family arabinose efflux permease
MSQFPDDRSGIVRQKHPQRHLVYLWSAMVFFWLIFDGILSYATPLIITQQGFSDAWMGVIYASSSVFGGIYDFLICRFFKNTNFRRMTMCLFALCLVYPLILWQAKTVWVFLIAMAIWGVYWDSSVSAILTLSPDT